MSDTIPTLTALELHAWICEGEPLLLIDVLPKASFDKQHLPGSVHVSQYEDDFLERVGELVEASTDRIVLYCNSQSCNASTKAAEKLVAAGYTQVFELAGGVREWADEGLPLRGSAR